MSGVRKRPLSVALALLLAGGSSAVLAGDREDRADKAVEAAAKAAERAARDSGKAAEDAARAADRQQTQEIRAAEDRAKAAADQQEKAAKDWADAQEEAAKDAADAEKEAIKAADDAADAAEEAAKQAEDAAERQYGSSESLRDLAAEEAPEFDSRGFPVRRGEVVGIDISEQSILSAKAAGFTVIDRTRLPGLGSEIIRFTAPAGMDSVAALKAIRSGDRNGTYDHAHYYGLLFSPQGSVTGKAGGKIKAKAGSLKIGMIDTGVSDHKSLAHLSLTKRDFSGGKSAAPEEHGTAIASLLASEGVSTIYAANIFTGKPSNPHTSADAIVRALDWMVEQKIPVINISLAGPRNSILDALVKKASGMGHVIVAAAGNGGPTAAPAYPAALPDVVAVTAVDKKLRVYRYANQGQYVRVAALGVDVSAAAPGGKTVTQSGTSFATPHIAAWMARCTGGKSAAARTKCLKKLEKAARDLGEPGRDAVYGFGYVS